MIGLSVPMINDNYYIDKLKSLGSNKNAECTIREVYGSLTEDIIGNLRSPNKIREINFIRLKDIISGLHESGISFSYIINSTITAGMEYTTVGIRRIYDFIQQLFDCEVDNVTVSHPFLISFIKNNFPKLRVTASICCGINTVSKAKEFESLGVDEIVLDRDINRNFPLIASIQKNVKCDIKVLCNSPCLVQCINLAYHANLSSALSNQILNKSLAINPNESFDAICSVYCVLKKMTHLEEIIKSPWIRPEDMKYYYSKGIKSFKIDGRDRKPEYVLKVINAYLNQSYEGNFLHIIQGHFVEDINNCFNNNFQLESEWKIGINNRDLDGFIVPFVLGEKLCTHDCADCKYCYSFSKKIVINNEWLNQMLEKYKSDFKQFLPDYIFNVL